jgi:acyl-homoserine-lactone acylase
MMTRTSTTKLKLTGRLLSVKIAAALAALILPATAQSPADTTAGHATTTIYRDGWGVPHIYSDTDLGMAFGFGYAQAEDRLDALLENYLTAIGRRSAAFGLEELDADFAQHLWGHEASARNAVASLPPETRDLIDAFIAGVRKYLLDHPDEAPEWAFTPESTHAIALARHLVWRDLIARADDELARKPSPGPFDQGHTLWALSPERSAEDASILCADPEGPWAGSLRYYEAHLHGDRTHVWGHTVPGLPVILFGHNRNLGWGVGASGPDAADVYEIDMTSTAASTFFYDGEGRRLALDTLRIDVRVGESLTSVERFAQRTADGPVLHRDGRKAYVYRIAGGDGDAIGQLYRMMKASDFASFYAALGAAQLGSRSILYSDRRGRVHYLQTGQTPVRSETEVWHLPVDGNTSNTAWQGFHTQNDLIQIVDPEQGWIRDISTSPDLLTAASPAIPDRYPAYIYNASPAQDPPRSRRLAGILSGYGRFTLQEVFDLVFDTYVADAHHWQRALADAWMVHGESADTKVTYDLIHSWDGRADPGSRGLAIYLTWREACAAQGRSIDPARVRSRRPVSTETARALIDALEQATRTHKERYGRLDIPWREIHRYRKDGRSWGLSGVAHPYAESLRRTAVTIEGVVGYADRGQAAPTVMVFHPARVESYTAGPFGQSDQTDSPHRWDQAETLFSKDRLRPTRFDQRKHLKEKRVLRLPQNPSPLPSSED